MTKPPEHHGQPIIEHPNRDKPESKTTRVVIAILLVVSAALIAIVTFGGWSALQGVAFVSIVWIVLYLLFAWYIVRWNRGVLPVVAALAMIMLIFAAIAVPSWFSRDAPAYAQTSIDANVLGTITALLVPVQALLLVAALYGFRQEWNVEVEHWPEDEGEDFALPAHA
ncbi:MAG TPA: hypothetical protein VMT10_15435 [Solirubrobacteraceae bacterium]|nr:hypothetical protein [Solirubrobacteraceae bacterium]